VDVTRARKANLSRPAECSHRVKGAVCLSSCARNVTETTRVSPTYDFRGQVAVVTGASSGVRRDTAHPFAAAGAPVVLADIDKAALRTATDELAAAGYTAH
jgi:hypothetical protein